MREVKVSTWSSPASMNSTIWQPSRQALAHVVDLTVMMVELYLKCARYHGPRDLAAIQAMPLTLASFVNLLCSSCIGSAGTVIWGRSVPAASWDLQQAPWSQVPFIHLSIQCRLPCLMSLGAMTQPAPKLPASLYCQNIPQHGPEATDTHSFLSLGVSLSSLPERRDRRPA